MDFSKLNRFAERVLRKPLSTEEHMQWREWGELPVLTKANSELIWNLKLWPDWTIKFESAEDGSMKSKVRRAFERKFPIASDASRDRIIVELERYGPGVLHSNTIDMNTWTVVWTLASDELGNDIFIAPCEDTV